jgi:steroid 5-alpha reductase family enzyme
MEYHCDLAMNSIKVKALLFVLISYFVASLMAIAIGFTVRFLHPLLMILIADITATIVIFTISTIIKNTSLYDPYWNIAPLIIAFYYLISPQSGNVLNWRSIIIFTLVLVWSVRLTFNWVRRWDGLKDEDWRYANYRKKMGKNFWFINFTGLQFMPTIIVYLGSVSLYATVFIRTEPLGFIDFLAIFITVTAIIIEALADQQLFKHLRNRTDPQKILTKGLWNYSRYPNYFGEILFWWGLYIFTLSADISYYWAIIGPISMTILFNVISIPLMEKRHLERKPNYPIYKERTSRLIFWFPKKKSSNEN